MDGYKAGSAYEVPDVVRDWQFYLMRFGRTKPGEEKLYWFRRLVEELLPDPVFIWDDWSDLFFGALCGAKETVERISGKLIEGDENWRRCVVATGAGATGKSARAAIWIIINWFVAREDTACILTSTSVDMLARRIWSDIMTWIGSINAIFASKNMPPLGCRIIPSDLEIRWNDSDRKHAIFGIAVKQGGNPQEAVDRIKGIHAPRIFVVIDEMTTVPDAIVKACRNLNKGTKEFQLIGLGNAISKTDPHGERSEPEKGWESITVEDKFWITRYGCSVHLDAYDSPAMTNPERFHFYPNKQNLDEEAKERGGLNSPDSWSNIRGFWPPSGLSEAIFDEAIFEQFHTREKAVWRSSWQMGGGFDVALEGGDRRVLYPFKFGEFATGVMGIEYMEPILVEIDSSTDKRFIHYAISDSVQRVCENYTVDGKKAPIPPENFVMDVTGEGGGVFAILSGRWSEKIVACEFGGAPPKTQISATRPTTWYELYKNRVTYLWYSLRHFIEGGQVRGLRDNETIKELTARDKKMVGGKIQALPKSEMKKFKSKSPDMADAAAVCIHLLIEKGYTPAGNTGGGPVVDPATWNVWADRTNITDGNDYGDENAGWA